MPLIPQPSSGRRLWRLNLLAFAALTLLGGCGTPNGDFGRVQPSLVRDDIHDWVGPAAVSRAGGVPSAYELTDDERELRDLAFPLIEPPYDRQRWDNVLREYGYIGKYQATKFDRTTYAAHLLAEPRRSPASSYARLTDDIRNDLTRMPQFFDTAARVADVDGKRQKSLAFISELSPYERANALRRVRENALIVAWVRDSLGQRVASYRFALERLVLITPSSQAAEVEHTLNRLAAANAQYRNALPPVQRPHVAEVY
jgi:hypothetical protein